MLVVLVVSGWAMAAPGDYFVIRVVDDQTGRPVPLVELRTVNSIRCWTDSGGRVAFLEPGLMGRRVFFFVRSDGYEYPADGFGYRGVALDVKAGATATVKVHRVNIAERMYRLTGEGIYSDTVLAGLAAPIAHPLLDARVLGQDSAVAVAYKGTAYWFWGDTARESYPLGHFGTAGATVDLAKLDVERGIDFDYYTDQEGFSAPTFKSDQPGPIWVGGALMVPDAAGKDALVVHYSRMKDLGTRLEHGLARFDFASHRFEKVKVLEKDETLCPDGQTLRAGDYFYFATPVPLLRVKAEWKDVTTPAAYEGFTCLAPGTRYAKEKSRIERDAKGHAVYAWKKDTPPVGFAQQRELIKAGLLKDVEAYLHARDAASGAPIELHAGSVNWNAFRKRYVMVAVQVGGKSSYLGEVYYLEADRPEGPWSRGVKIVTHDHYTFYNPVQHDFLDRDGGRVIYFEGTYANTFSGNPEQTPRYDYNQILYRLDLADPRLKPAH